MSNLNTALATTLLASPILLLGPFTALLYRGATDAKEESPQKVKFPVSEEARITVSCTTTGGVSKRLDLRSKDVKTDFHHHGEHWRYAQGLGIDDFEDYWWHLLGDLGPAGEQNYLFKDSAVELGIGPVVNRQGKKQILVSFRYSECKDAFREMILEVPEEKDLESEGVWRQQKAHIRYGHGERVTVKIGDLGDSDYEVFRMVMVSMSRIFCKRNDMRGGHGVHWLD